MTQLSAPHRVSEIPQPSAWYPVVMLVCSVLVAGALGAAWLMTGWYGAGMVFVGWISLSIIAGVLVGMQQQDAKSLDFYVCAGDCHEFYRYGTERWIDKQPYCRPCASVVMEALFHDS